MGYSTCFLLTREDVRIQEENIANLANLVEKFYHVPVSLLVSVRFDLGRVQISDAIRYHSRFHSQIVRPTKTEQREK